MTERAHVGIKKPEVKRANRASQTQRTSQSISSPVEQILFLQRTIGNQTVGRLIKSWALHAKLRIGQPGDIYEQEADRVAEQVLRMPEPKAVSGKTPDNPVQRACMKCSGRRLPEEEEVLQPKGVLGSAPEITPDMEVSINAARGSGQPLPESVRAFFEPRFGYDFSGVRVHTDAKAAEVARRVDARAFTVGRDIVFGAGEYAPEISKGQRLLAHELTHMAQQEVIRRPTIQRYGTPIPTVTNPTVTTMRQFIDLVRRVEAANPGRTALQMAQMIMRSKYHSTGFDWLLPSTASTSGVAAGPGVTAGDVTTLSGEFTVTLPQGGESDPSHIVTAIVANAETQAPGAGGAGGIAGRLVANLPSGLSQLDVASWAGDPGSAAAEWMTAHPHPNGGTTMQNYMDEYSPEFDLIGDVDGVAMTSTSSSFGFVFNAAQPLSDNLERFYFPSAPREGKNRRYHTFCAVLGFSLEPDGVTLSNSATTAIDNRIHSFADWFIANDPNIQTWMQLNSPPPVAGGGLGGMSTIPTYNPIWGEWIRRANDWRWFSQKFRTFVQRNLTAEGP